MNHGDDDDDNGGGIRDGVRRVFSCAVVQAHQCAGDMDGNTHPKVTSFTVRAMWGRYLAGGDILRLQCEPRWEGE